MAVSKEFIKNIYPLPAYNYKVSILKSSSSLAAVGAILKDSSALSAVISCSEVSGLNMELESVSYRDGMSFLYGSHIIPAQKKEVNFSIKKGVVRDSNYFTKWIGLVYPFIIPRGQGSQKRNVVIDLCDENGNPVVRWLAVNAMPIKLEAPTFDANSNEVAFESLSLIASALRVDYI